MSAIHDLIGQIGDPRLRERLAAEWMAASTGKKFGLVFEYHLPELLPLHKVKPRKEELSISVSPTIEGFTMKAPNEKAATNRPFKVPIRKDAGKLDGVML